MPLTCSNAQKGGRKRRKSVIPYFLSSKSSTAISDHAKEHFQNCNVLITGATGGLGKAIAFQFASQCNIRQLILSGRSEEKLNLVASECRDKSNNEIDIITMPCDLSNLEEVRKFGEEVT